MPVACGSFAPFKPEIIPIPCDYVCNSLLIPCCRMQENAMDAELIGNSLEMAKRHYARLVRLELRALIKIISRVMPHNALNTIACVMCTFSCMLRASRHRNHHACGFHILRFTRIALISFRLKFVCARTVGCLEWSANGASRGPGGASGAPTPPITLTSSCAISLANYDRLRHSHIIICRGIWSAGQSWSRTSRHI